MKYYKLVLEETSRPDEFLAALCYQPSENVLIYPIDTGGIYLLTRLKEETISECVWKRTCIDDMFQEDLHWETDCGNSFWFVYTGIGEPDGLKEHKFKFCPFCGREILEREEETEPEET